MRRSHRYTQTGLSNISALLVVLGIVALALVSIFVVMRRRGIPEPTAGSPLTIEVTTTPDDAEITIDGKPAGVSKARQDLSGGKHELLVSRRGYLSWQQTLEASGALRIPVTLQAIPMDLRILPGPEKADVWLDDQPQPGSPDGSGGWTLTGVPQGSHSVRIKTSTGESTVSFDFRNGNPAAPVLPNGNPIILFISSSDGNV